MIHIHLYQPNPSLKHMASFIVEVQDHHFNPVKLIFANFVKLGVFLKIIRGTMWHYVALWGAIKNAEKVNFGNFCEIWRFPKTPPGQYVVLCATIKNAETNHVCKFCEIWSFPQNHLGHYVALWGPIKNAEKVHFGNFL